MNSNSQPLTTQYLTHAIENSQLWRSKQDSTMIQTLNVHMLAATTCVTKQPQENLQQLILTDRPDHHNLGRKLFAQLHLIIPHTTNKKLHALVDSGSDISLIDIKLLEELVPSKYIQRHKQKSNIKLESFSNHPIEIMFDIILPMTFNVNSKTVSLPFRVYQQVNTFPLLIGQDIMAMTGLIISYAPGLETPQMRQTKPYSTPIKTLFSFPTDANTCIGHVHLKPQETKPIIMHPHPLCTIKPGETVLISDSDTTNIFIIPTRYQAYQQPNKPYMACVTNMGNQTFSGSITGKIEQIDYLTFLDQKATDEELEAICQVQHEVLAYENPPKQLPVIKMLENLPEKNLAAQTPVKAYLLLTPYESKQVICPEKPNRSQTHPLDLQDKSSAIDKDLIDELQNIHPDITPNKPPDPPDEPEQDIPESLVVPQGYEIPCNLPATLAEIVKLDQFEEPHREHIERIFLKTYPSVIATHSFDIGDISRTLGFYKIELKDNEQLPAFRKMYYLAPQDLLMMRDICSYLVKYGIIERASHQDKISHLLASPGYLVSRPNPLSAARLIIDYRIINQVIKTSPPSIPCIQNVLQQLRGKTMYTSSDLTSAYYSVTLDPSCRHLTRFIVDDGSFLFKKVPMGLSLSPAIFSEIAHRMIHMTPRLDKTGNPIFLKPNMVDMVHDRLEGVYIFYDDLLISSPLYETYEQTVKEHYKLVEKVISRLHFHRAKLSFEKSVFGKTSIKFLGWIVSQDKLIPDSKRINKLIATEFPNNLKAMRSFTGLFNSLCNCMPHVFMKELSALNPLCSSVKVYSPQQQHRDAFESLKRLLVTKPLFSNIIIPSARKILFVDASDKGCYSAVLGQLHTIKPGQLHIPDHLLLDDPIDRIIFKHKLCYKFAPLYLHDTYILRSKLDPPYDTTPHKDPIYLNTDFMGYPEDKIDDSLVYSIRSIQYAYGCQLTEGTHLKADVIEKLKTHIARLKLLTFSFQNDKTKLNEFLSNFQYHNGPVDISFHLIDVIASVLNRPITVISALPEHKDKQIQRFGCDSSKPPFVLGVVRIKTKMIFRPYYVDRNTSFNLTEIKDQFQIVAFWSKSISKEDAKKAIVEKELFAILASLESFSKLIGKSKVLCLTDSKPLFLLFSNPVTRSSSKISRWGLKLSLDYPLLTLRFISTSNNIADYLTRDYNLSRPDLERLPIQNFDIPGLNTFIDPEQEFSLNEWKAFVQKHEHLLKYTTNNIPVTVNALTQAIKNVNKLLDPLKALKHKMSHENIALQQKWEFQGIINKLVTQPDLVYTYLDHKYQLIAGVLYIFIQDEQKIMLPQSLEGTFLAFFHLSLNHAGITKMTAALFPYHFPQKYKKIRHLTSRCYSCSLQNQSTHKMILGSYPIPSYMFETASMDLIESLPTNAGYSHILLIICPLTKFTLLYPLKDKTANNVAYHVLFNLVQFFRVKYIVADNGPAFTQTLFLTLLHTQNIQRVQLASVHPISNGFCESHVKVVKYILKKTLATYETYSWLHILPIIQKLLNGTPLPPANYSPLQLLHGYNSPIADIPYFDPPLTKVYPPLQNDKLQLDQKMKETTEVIQFVRNHLQRHKKDLHDKLNKNRSSHNLKLGDFVFARDRQIVLGNQRPLKTTWSADPWVVLQLKPTSALIRRLSDSFTTIYGYADIKKYSRLDPEFSTLPHPVRDVLINDFQALDALHFETLRAHSELNIPLGVEINPIQDDIDDPSDTVEASSATPSPPIPFVLPSNPILSSPDDPALHINTQLRPHPNVTPLPPAVPSTDSPPPNHQLPASPSLALPDVPTPHTLTDEIDLHTVPSPSTPNSHTSVSSPQDTPLFQPIQDMFLHDPTPRNVQITPPLSALLPALPLPPPPGFPSKIPNTARRRGTRIPSPQDARSASDSNSDDEIHHKKQVSFT